MTASASRESILEGIFSYLTAGGAYQNTSRRLVHWTQAAAQPALYLRTIAEHHERQIGAGQAQKLTMDLEVWIYAQTGAPDTAPSSVISPLLDALDRSLVPGPLEPGRNTLGGLVEHVYREGETTITEGELGTQAVAIVPLKVLAVLYPY